VPNGGERPIQILQCGKVGHQLSPGAPANQTLPNVGSCCLWLLDFNLSNQPRQEPGEYGDGDDAKLKNGMPA
ncbi:MAG: hypothetical protein KBT60_09525, partial [Methyloceanibacter sp.]|nr:hypothetical protein [Methyloceanibacter sp.]